MTSYEEINEGLIDTLVLRRYFFGNWITSGDMEIQKPSLPILEPAVFIGEWLRHDDQVRIWSKFNVESKEDFLYLYSHIVCKFCVKFYDLKINNVSWYLNQLT